MRALDRKLFRDLWLPKVRLRQSPSSSAAGIATYVMAASTLQSLTGTQARLYREFRFPDLFSGLKRAPQSVLDRVAAIPGVTAVESRVAAPANV
jgi:putative ABC transport system permease protein